jgi:FMN phosphatase YigB (HAD superfamily)
MVLKRPSPVWLFDLDNTLHDASPHIFPQINRAMVAYIREHLGVDERRRRVFGRTTGSATAPRCSA